MMKEHWRICSTRKDDIKILQREHFGSYRDAIQYLIMMHSVVVEGEFVDIVKDFDTRIYPLWRANGP